MISGLKPRPSRYDHSGTLWEPKTRWLADWNFIPPSSEWTNYPWEPKTRWLADWNVHVFVLAWSAWLFPVRTKDAMISGLKLRKSWQVTSKTLLVRTKDAMISGLKLYLGVASRPPQYMWEPKTRWLADWNSEKRRSYDCAHVLWEPKTRWLADWNFNSRPIDRVTLRVSENQRRDD